MNTRKDKEVNKYKRNIDEEKLARQIDNARKRICDNNCSNCVWGMAENNCLLITGVNYISSRYRTRLKNTMKQLHTSQKAEDMFLMYDLLPYQDAKDILTDAFEAIYPMLEDHDLSEGEWLRFWSARLVAFLRLVKSSNHLNAERAGLDYED